VIPLVATVESLHLRQAFDLRIQARQASTERLQDLDHTSPVGPASGEVERRRRTANPTKP
jgi:hypothetical protein